MISNRIISKLLILIIFTILNSNLFAQSYISYGSQSSGVSNSNVASTGINSVFINPSALSFKDKWSVQVFAERKFNQGGINTLGVGLILPSKSGTFAFKGINYGNEFFRESFFGFGYGRKIFDFFSIGASIDYLRYRIEGYGSKNIFTFDAGLISNILPHVRVGASVFSPFASKITSTENIPFIFNFGLNWEASKELEITAAVQKQIDFKASIRGGINYKLHKNISLRVGAQNNPTTFSFGIGFNMNNFGIDAASNYHQTLGFTQNIGAYYEGK